LHDAIGIIALQDGVELGTALLDLRVLHGGVLDAIEVMVPVGSEDELILGSMLQVDDGITATVEPVDQLDAVLADSIGEGGHLLVEGCTSLIGKELSHYCCILASPRIRQIGINRSKDCGRWVTMFALFEAGIQVARLQATPRFGCASRGANHIGPLRGPAPYLELSMLSPFGNLLLIRVIRGKAWAMHRGAYPRICIVAIRGLGRPA
jgi:hypothetical protein